MALIPVPGRPIVFGSVKSVQLRTSFEIALLVNWRIVLQAFIDPISVIYSQGVHGHSQWIDVARNVSVDPEASFFFLFYAWADGILRYAFHTPAPGNWFLELSSFCKFGPSMFKIVAAHPILDYEEKDIIGAGITNGRWYKLGMSHDSGQQAGFSMDVGIIDAPIVQA